MNTIIKIDELSAIIKQIESEEITKGRAIELISEIGIKRLSEHDAFKSSFCKKFEIKSTLSWSCKKCNGHFHKHF